MKVIPISTHLSEFGVNKNSPATHEPAILPVDDYADEARERKKPEHGFPEQYQLALAEAKKQGEADAALKYQADIEQMTGEFQVQLDGVQNALGKELKQIVEKRLEQLETKLSNTIAGILRPFLPRLLKQRILSQFKSVLTELMSDPHDQCITISGPASLVAGLKKSFRDSDTPLTFVENDSQEIVVEVELTKLESKFQRWSEMMDAEVE